MQTFQLMTCIADITDEDLQEIPGQMIAESKNNYHLIPDLPLITPKVNIVTFSQKISIDPLWLLNDKPCPLYPSKNPHVKNKNAFQ